MGIGLLKRAVACILVMLSCNLPCTEAGSKPARMQAMSQTLHLTPPKNGESPYHYVPFQVPPGASQITISYDYDRANGLNVLDIGLFDSRSTEFEGDMSGFRGWSGGRRSEFFVSHEAATPGYIPGELPAGTWRIILGLYRVVPQGVDVSFKINIETGLPNEPRSAWATPTSNKFAIQPRSSSVVKSERGVSQRETSARWVSGDLHMHTVNSDGDWTVSQLIDAAKDARLDFICITDHNTFSHHAEIDRLSPGQTGLLIIRGEEITTYGGHANAWGLPANTVVDFRVAAGDQKAIARVASDTRRHGALISINHPFATCAGCNWSYDQDANGFDAIEVWNGSWDTSDEQALAWWDSLLQKGRRITAVASSDSHRPANPIGQAATHVAIAGSLSVTSILESIRGGHVYLTGAATVPSIDFEAETPENHATYSIGEAIPLGKSRLVRFKLAVGEIFGSRIISLISKGQVMRNITGDADGRPQFVELYVPRDTYFRMEVRDQNGKMLALTNPIYVETRR